MNNVHFERYRRMLEFQEEIKPFTPTIRELMELWKLSSSSAVMYSLRRIGQMGLLLEREYGKTTRYYAVKR